MASATAFNYLTGQRKVVQVGDPNAFAGGFQLETPTNNLQTYRPPVAPVAPTLDQQYGNTRMTLAPTVWPSLNPPAGFIGPTNLPSQPGAVPINQRPINQIPQDLAAMDAANNPNAPHWQAPVASNVAPVTATPTRVLLPDEIVKLNEAAQRVNAGTANKQDSDNVLYATQKLGYTPPALGGVPSNVASVPNTPVSVSAGDITGSSISAPSGTSTSSPDSFMAGIKAWQDAQNQYMAGTDAGIAGLNEDRSALADQKKVAQDALGNRANRTNELNNQYGIPEADKRLAELNLQIANLTAQFDKADASLENYDATGLATTIGGKQGQIRRQKAVEVGALAAVQQALTGNLALAKQTIKDVVDMEHQDQQDKVDALQSQLDLNRDSLDEADKKRAEQLQIFLDGKNQEIDSQKETKTNVLNLALTAAGYGADTETIAKITQAKTIEEGIKAAGKFLAPPAVAVKKDIQVIDINGRKVLVNLQTNEQVDLGDANSPLDYAKYDAEIAKMQAAESGATPNQWQFQSIGYADRMKASDDTIVQIGDKFASIPTGSWAKYMPNWAKSADAQLFDQAKRNFVNAKLRQESGAVISPEEFKNAELQYFPQIGDTPEALVQKAQNRQMVMANMQAMSGPQYSTYSAYGTGALAGGTTESGVASEWDTIDSPN